MTKIAKATQEPQFYDAPIRQGLSNKINVFTAQALNNRAQP
jgi:hypothetical protein